MKIFDKLQWIKLLKKKWNDKTIILDFHNYRLVLYPKLKFIIFPKGYTYYKYPKLQRL